jgi:uncharacterized protein (TIGR02265 family)
VPKPRGESPGIKGSVLRSRLTYVRERGGEAGAAKVLALLPEADRAVLTGWILNTSWYPLELNLRLDDAIAQVFAPDDRRRVFLEMGRASADVNLTGPHRHFVDPHDPHTLLSQSTVIYAAYYAVGRRDYERTGATSCVLRTFDAESVTETDCLTVIGWYVRAIEMCGGQDVQVDEPVCRARGGDHCEYACRWR